MASDEAGVSSARKKHFGFVSPGLWQAALMGLLVFIAYIPALHGDFLWDDDTHITANPALRTLGGLRDIWFKPGATCQYYPLTFTGFWTGYHLWGLNPPGYHLLTLWFHVLASVLFWQVLVRLKVRGAWLAGAIFALHPVNVMSVAWMTELKNTLSATLALGSVWAYLCFARLGVYAAAGKETGRAASGAAGIVISAWRWYGLALALFVLAMLAKTAVSFVPVSLLLITWWQRQRLGWREVWPVLPMAGLVPLFGAMTVYVERLTGASGEKFSLGILERVLISGRSFWFYLGKLFFPYPLTFIYERWTVDAGVWWQYFYPAATVALLAGLWWWRGRLGRGPLVALLHFYVSTSLLILGVVLYMTQYSFVSDHWQYFGCMGVIGLVAAGMTAGFERVAPSKSLLKPVLCSLLLLLLGLLTWRQCGIYRDSETLWLDTLAKNPACWMAHNNLCYALLLKGQTDEAIRQAQEALRLKPDDAEAHINLGKALDKMGQTDEAIRQYREALRLKPNSANAFNNLGTALGEKGQTDEATRLFQEALRLKPDYAEAHYNLGVVFDLKGQTDEAIRQYREALRLKPDFAEAHNNLGATLYRKGQTNEALSQFQEALHLKPDYAEAQHNVDRVLGMTNAPAGR
jgi:protein O-mannosyl-transferase